MLMDFCERNGLVITNTWFKKRRRRLYTWKSLGDRSRYQLDYVLVKQRFRNSVEYVQTLPRADIDSNHNLLVATICTRLKNIIRFHKRKPGWDLEKLYAQRQEVHDSLEEKLSPIKCESGNVEVQWNNIKKCVLHTMSDLVGKVEGRAKKPWITQEMISKMDERRKWKNVNNEEGRKNYRRLRKNLKEPRATPRRNIWRAYATRS
jgi:flagellar biosynthesis chaperone FliJ